MLFLIHSPSTPLVAIRQVNAGPKLCGTAFEEAS